MANGDIHHTRGCVKCIQIVAAIFATVAERIQSHPTPLGVHSQWSFAQTHA